MTYRVWVHYNQQKHLFPRDEKDLVIHVVRQQNRDVFYEICVKNTLACARLSQNFRDTSLITHRVNPFFSVYNTSLPQVFEGIGLDQIENQEILDSFGSVGLSFFEPTENDMSLFGFDVLVVPESLSSTKVYAHLSRRLTRITSLEKDTDLSWHLSMQPFLVTIARPYEDVVQTIEFLTGVEPICV
jgi:hypothetical protein